MLSHLQDALESLREAREGAGMGTSLMLDPIIDDLERLINRVETIQDATDNDDGN